VSGWGDNVSSGGGGGGGSIPGNTSTPDDILTAFVQVEAQAAGDFDLPTYTIPNNGSLYHLMLVEFGGTNVAKYSLYFGSALKARYATWFAGGLNGKWDYRGPPGGLPIGGGTILKISCSHNRPEVGDFWAKLTLLKVN
jgi:hypothetical protein